MTIWSMACHLVSSHYRDGPPCSPAEPFEDDPVDRPHGAYATPRWLRGVFKIGQKEPAPRRPDKVAFGQFNPAKFWPDRGRRKPYFWVSREEVPVIVHSPYRTLVTNVIQEQSSPYQIDRGIRKPPRHQWGSHPRVCSHFTAQHIVLVYKGRTNPTTTREKRLLSSRFSLRRHTAFSFIC
jgi:hypothetical protein